MKIIKTTFIMFLTICVIFMVSGCQKDSVSPKLESTKQTDSSSSKPNKKDSENNNLENHKNESKESNTKTETNAQGGSKTVTKKDEQTNGHSKKQDSQQQAPKQITSSMHSNSKSKTNTNNQTNTKSSSPNNTTKTTEPQSSITISIVSNDLKKTIVTATKVNIKNGDTLLDATREILKQKGIVISVRGSGASAYVEGIGDLYEFDHGPLSGWTAKKNGIVLDRSAGITTLKNGDSIQWNYTTDYTKDNK